MSSPDPRQDVAVYFQAFTARAKNAIALANQEAHRLNHEYIGTEHLLLGLLHEPAGVAAGAIRTLGVDPQRVHAEIEKLIPIGPAPISIAELPLTPRARMAIELANNEARIFRHKQIDAEHLMLGLIREPDGVAALALRNLGIDPGKLRQEVFRIRLAQFTIVERAVRPVRAGTPRKRKMREELLAHLTAIYEEELANQGDPAAAMEAAAGRFGDVAQLSRELDQSVGFRERHAYNLERRFGWRAPETAARYMFRVAVQLFFIIAVALLVIAGGAVIGPGMKYGLWWDRSIWIAILPAAAFWFFIPIDVFLLGLLYFKMRDTLCGAAWARKSLSKAVLYDVLIALVALGSGMGFVALTRGDVSRAMESLPAYIAAGVAAAVFCAVYARVVGPTEIADTTWACLDIG